MKIIIFKKWVLSITTLCPPNKLIQSISILLKLRKKGICQTNSTFDNFSFLLAINQMKTERLSLHCAKIKLCGARTCSKGTVVMELTLPSLWASFPAEVLYFMVTVGSVGVLFSPPVLFLWIWINTGSSEALLRHLRSLSGLLYKVSHLWDKWLELSSIYLFVCLK